MSSDNFWDLFAETGDIGYYLLYIENSGKDRVHTAGQKDCTGIQPAN